MRGWNRVVGRRSGNAPSWLIFRLLGSCFGMVCGGYVGALLVYCK